MSGQTTMRVKTGDGEMPRHDHRTAKVVELIGSSKKSFEAAVQGALRDAAASTRGITGAHIENFSVRFDGENITEYKVNLKVVFGIERTAHP